MPLGAMPLAVSVSCPAAGAMPLAVVLSSPHGAMPIAVVRRPGAMPMAVLLLGAGPMAVSAPLRGGAVPSEFDPLVKKPPEGGVLPG